MQKVRNAYWQHRKNKPNSIIHINVILVFCSRKVVTRLFHLFFLFYFVVILNIKTTTSSINKEICRNVKKNLMDDPQPLPSNLTPAERCYLLHKQASKRYYDANKIKVLERMKEYYEAHKEVLRVYKAEYYQNHRRKKDEPLLPTEKKWRRSVYHVQKKRKRVEI